MNERRENTFVSPELWSLLLYKSNLDKVVILSLYNNLNLIACMNFIVNARIVAIKNILYVHFCRYNEGMTKK